MNVVNKPESGQENHNFFSILQNCLTAGIVVVDGHNRIVTFTPQAEFITSVPAAEILGQEALKLPAALRKIAQKVSTTGRPVNHAEIILAGKEQKDLAVNVTAAPLYSGKTKKKRGATLVLHDITSAKRLEDALRRLDRLASIGTLSASTAHEIKNALVAVKTFMDLLLEKHSDAELVGIVRREMARIESIISQLLRFAAPPRTALSVVRLHEVLDHSLHTVQSQLNAKQISLQRKFNAVADGVKGDDYQLQQAFVNLLLNGIEATGQNGELSIATEVIAQPGDGGDKTENLVRVTIADNGAGIPSENLVRLFEPFFTTKKHGTGLGLSITQRIIQSHRGFIHVESESGKGSTFHISFPVLANG